jgi:hypothetical protein
MTRRPNVTRATDVRDVPNVAVNLKLLVNRYLGHADGHADYYLALGIINNYLRLLCPAFLEKFVNRLHPWLPVLVIFEK